MDKEQIKSEKKANTAINDLIRRAKAKGAFISDELINKPKNSNQ